MSDPGVRRHGASRRVLRVLGRAIAGVVLAALAVGLVVPLLHAALVRDDRPALRVRLADPPPGTYTVHVADWGYHSAVIVPQVAGWRLGPAGRETAAFVEYAWGDRAFYRDSDFRPHALYATLALPTPSVAYVEGHDAPPVRGPRALYARQVDAATLRALVTELERSVRQDATGRRVGASAPVRGYRGRFHDAHGAYSWAHDCNHWTVARLAAVGLATSPRGVVLSGQVAGRIIGFTTVLPANR